MTPVRVVVLTSGGPQAMTMAVAMFGIGAMYAHAPAAAQAMGPISAQQAAFDQPRLVRVGLQQQQFLVQQLLLRWWQQLRWRRRVWRLINRPRCVGRHRLAARDCRCGRRAARPRDC